MPNGLPTSCTLTCGLQRLCKSPTWLGKDCKSSSANTQKAMSGMLAALKDKDCKTVKNAGKALARLKN